MTEAATRPKGGWPCSRDSRALGDHLHMEQTGWLSPLGQLLSLLGLGFLILPGLWAV